MVVSSQELSITFLYYKIVWFFEMITFPLQTLFFPVPKNKKNKNMKSKKLVNTLKTIQTGTSTCGPTG